MKHALLIALAAAALSSNVAAEPVATKLWESDAVFKQPESACFDSERNVIYVSNMDGDARAKDGHGFISRMTPDGHVTDLEWVTGLSAPKGLALVGSKLYAADIDTLVEIDVDTATVTNRFAVPGAQFLNDVTADVSGDVYVSDMLTNRIHRLHNGVLETWLEGDMLENPNGLFAKSGKLYLGSWGAIKGAGFETKVPGHVKVIDMNTKTVSDFGSAKPIGNMDGIVLMNDGNILATDWMAGSLMIVKPNGKVRQLLDLNQGSADLDYFSAGSIAFVPMMMDGKVVAYSIAEPPPPAPPDGAATGGAAAGGTEATPAAKVEAPTKAN
jgi:sugar lactone lactonase YvrE